VHAEAFSQEKYPLEHEAQPLDPAEAANVSFEHAEHAIDSAFTEYIPASHFEQLIAPTTAYWPETQLRHANDPEIE